MTNSLVTDERSQGPKPPGNGTHAAKLDTLEQSKRRIGANLSHMLIPVLGLAIALVVCTIVVAAVQIGMIAMRNTVLTHEDQWLSILLVHLVKIGGGISIGMICFFLGAAVCWLNISGDFEVESNNATLQLRIKGANAGLFILSAGLIISTVSLVRPFEVTSSALSVKSADRVETSSNPNTESDKSPSSAVIPALENLDAITRSSEDSNAIRKVLEILRKKQPTAFETK